MPIIIGLPFIANYASELNLSPNYFGGLIKKETGKSAQEYIRNKTITIGKDKIFDSTKTIYHTNSLENKLISLNPA